MTSLPKVSLFVFSYNQQCFITEAIHGALAQDYANLQIIFSDDASTDETFELINTALAGYTGQHEIVINRNPANLGIGRHFIRIMEQLADGELVVASAGDDISAPNRVSRIVEEWLAQGKPGVLAHALAEIDEQGQQVSDSRTVQYRLQEQPAQWPAQLALYSYLQSPFPLPYIGAALAYRRDLYMQFGTPAAEPAYEDHLMYFRALLSQGLHYFPQPLVQYRRHANNFTVKPARSKWLPVPELFRALLPNPAEFTADKVGLFRLHQLSTQQWLDYCLAVRQGLLSADVTVVAVLWQQLSWRHHRLIRLKGGFGTPLAQRWQSGLQVCHLLSAWLGWRRYRRQSLVTADYAPALRTVLFGAGSGGRQALANLPAGFELVAVCDNNSKLHGSNFCGLPVISPQQLQQQQQDIDCIMVASTYFYEIKAKLTEELGLPAVKISRAPYAVITQPFPAGETATLSLVLLLAIALALSVLAALWLS